MNEVKGAVREDERQVISPVRIIILDCGEPGCGTRCFDQLAILIPQWFQPEVFCVNTITNLERVDESFSPNLVILRISCSKNDSGLLLAKIRRRWAPVPIFCFYCDKEVTHHKIVHALRNGVADYVCCPLRDIDLIPRLRRLLPTDNEALALSYRLEEESGQFRHDSLVGTSACFLQKVNQIPKLAHSDATLLITGETGTGKELFAQAIHYHSHRKSKPFIPVNCSALPDQLFENELFGHESGAYTHANTAQTGLVTEAEGGTLFLDEIDSLTPSAQAKLLRFLQNGEFRPLGSPKSHKADIRIIAATNADLRERVGIKQFREDLYYRLNVLALIVPPLRNRREDIPLLVMHLLKRNERGFSKSGVRCSSASIDKLMRYNWPGNVRELEGVIQRAVTFATGPSLEPEDFDLPVQEEPSGQGEGMRSAKFQVVGNFERTYLINLLARSHGNVSQAAKTAGKERRTFQRLMRKHGLNGNNFRHPQ